MDYETRTHTGCTVTTRTKNKPLKEKHAAVWNGNFSCVKRKNTFIQNSAVPNSLSIAAVVVVVIVLLLVVVVVQWLTCLQPVRLPLP
jgi:hypothetical protein